jgi:hypothetical protein
MTVAVWPINPQFTMPMTKTFATFVADFGDGYEQRGGKNIAYSHANGQGAVASNKGRWGFQIQLNGIDYLNGDITKETNILWKFVTDRLGLFEAFYFYNPVEASIDLTGSSAIGRYLVRLKDPAVSLEAFALKLHRGQIALIEVRT